MQTGRDYGAPQPRLRIPYQPTKASLHFHYALRFCNPVTRAHVRLLGPCFKTGRMGNRQDTKAEYHSNYYREHLRRRTGSRNRKPCRNNANASRPELEADTLSITVGATALDTRARHSPTEAGKPPTRGQRDAPTAFGAIPEKCTRESEQEAAA